MAVENLWIRKKGRFMRKKEKQAEARVRTVFLWPWFKNKKRRIRGIKITY
jgi:hypothetical protein